MSAAAGAAAAGPPLGEMPPVGAAPVGAGDDRSADPFPGLPFGEMPPGEAADVERFLAGLSGYSPAAAALKAEPFSLAAVTDLLNRLGSPQDAVPVVHVAGTNGKGSTVAFLNGILTAAGLKTGAFTSPFLIRREEMIRIGGEPIPTGDFLRLAGDIRAVCAAMQRDGRPLPSEFEVFCAVAFLYFREQACEVVLLEVGLGGRLDATNVIRTSMLSVITPIGLDHTEILGSRIEAIAAEKAGIIKPGGRVLLASQLPAVTAVIQAVCDRQQAALIPAAAPARTAVPSPGADPVPPAAPSLEDTPECPVHPELSVQPAEQWFRLPEAPDWPAFRIGMPGPYQVENAALAAQAARLLREQFPQITADAVRAGLAAVRWPGRFEVLCREPLVVADGCHNADGARRLAEALRCCMPGRRIRFVIGVLADKAYGAVLEPLLPLAESFYTVRVPSPRALPAEALAAVLTERGAEAVACDSIEAALRRAVRDAGSADAVCACGSLYYMGAVRRFFMTE